MKKAYVKPVFVAEEFVAETSYAATGCPTNYWAPVSISNGTQLCADDSGHVIGAENGKKGIINQKDGYSTGVSYWDYASWGKDKRPDAGDDTYAAEGTYLFNSGSKVCDFVWDNTANEVGVWRQEKDADGLLQWVVKMIEGAKFAPFFFGNSATISQHSPAYNGTMIPS